MVFLTFEKGFPPFSLTLHPVANGCFYLSHPLLTANFAVSSLSITICAKKNFFLRRVTERIGHRFGGQSWFWIPVDVMQRKIVCIWREYCKPKNRDKRQNSNDIIFIDGLSVFFFIFFYFEKV